jgi:hypothetical protein
MDACGAHTRTLDNHHSHDSDRRRAPYEPGGRSGSYFIGKNLRTLGGRGKRLGRYPRLGDLAEDAGLHHASDRIEQTLAKLRIAEDRVSTELSTRLEPSRVVGAEQAVSASEKSGLSTAYPSSGRSYLWVHWNHVA